MSQRDHQPSTSVWASWSPEDVDAWGEGVAAGTTPAPAEPVRHRPAGSGPDFKSIAAALGPEPLDQPGETWGEGGGAEAGIPQPRPAERADPVQWAAEAPAQRAPRGPAPRDVREPAATRAAASGTDAGLVAGERRPEEPGGTRLLAGALPGLWWFVALVLGLRVAGGDPWTLTWGDAAAAAALVVGSTLLLAMVRGLRRSPWPFALVFALVFAAVVAATALLRSPLVALPSAVGWGVVAAVALGGFAAWASFVALHPPVVSG